MNINEYKPQMRSDCIYYGEAGCGKTTKLCKMALKAKHPILLSFTNKAVENVKKTLQKCMMKMKRSIIYISMNNINAIHLTHFYDFHGRDIPDLEGKTIFIEEYSIVPNTWLTKIYHAFTKYHNTIYLFGVTNECDPVERNSQTHYNYLESKTMLEVCPKRVKLEYIGGCSRYGRKTPDMLTKFLKTGTVQLNFPAVGKYYNNICYFNQTRKITTALCCNNFVKNRKYYQVNFRYCGNKETYNVVEGMPVLVTQNLKNEDMYNMMKFKIDEIRKVIDDEGKKHISYKINDKCFVQYDFRHNFIPAFCCTEYKYQGADIKEHFNILDVNNRHYYY